MDMKERTKIGESHRPNAMLVLVWLIAATCYWIWDIRIAVLVFLSLLYVQFATAHIIWNVRKEWPK